MPVFRRDPAEQFLERKKRAILRRQRRQPITAQEEGVGPITTPLEPSTTRMPEGIFQFLAVSRDFSQHLGMRAHKGRLPQIGSSGQDDAFRPLPTWP